ncbi:iron complex outermembrane recepter protein [Pseudoalteromonas sp. BSi20652]|uniref:TonB-dependent receptor plug domain-containing protein n=1 Tax=Pseudoalteromonas sp. BSi20652 TaxID=388384 RepID=UPI000231AB0E|nr:TonB-dependent receptor [Pseudoalteromonas sp. BSi20652]GAA58390.1 iron complex outermembrane recepter protein [Pseudoalteromonas sp. BSi20652]
MKISQHSLWTLFFVSPILIADPFEDSDLDLNALMEMDVQVTSAMKRAQSAFDTASSIYVLSKEQISKSGANSVPEALKMVPGLIVRQLDNNQWAISSRGVASRFSSKLLVMIDGQSLYTPKFAAVYWESLNVPLYDIERIEVIRGQGGLLWGSNANNGVINIITKNSIDTRGGYVNATTGSQLNLDANLRYGGDISNIGSYRVYGHIKNSNASKKGIFLTPSDTAKQHSFGIRADFTPNDEWSGLFQGDVTKSELGQNYRGVIDDTNVNMSFSGDVERTDSRIMARLENRMSPDANQMLQLSWFRQDGNQEFINENFESIDIDYQMNFIYESLQLDWGLSYRYSKISFDDSLFLESDKDLDNLQQFGGLIQAQYNIIPDTLDFIIGTKFDHNDLTGWENQPSARLVYKPLENHLVWSAVSRSVRTPTLIEFNDDYKVDGTTVLEALGTSTGVKAIDEYTIATYLNGNDKVDSENYVSYELGYRFNDDYWSVDFSAFHTDAENIAVISSNTNPAQFLPALGLFQAGLFQQAAQALTSTRIDLDVVSVGETTTDGFDVVLAWQIMDKLSTELGYSYTKITYDLPSGTVPTIGFDSTNRQIFTKVNYSLEDHNIFATLRVENSDAYVSDNYTTLDLTWNYQITPTWSTAFSGKNLFAGSHIEYANTSETYTLPNYIDESISFSITANF